MIVANYLLNISTVPWWLKHAQDVGLTVIDLIATALLAAYQAALQLYLLPFVLAAPHGGLPGSFGWTAMLIYASVFGDLFHGGQRSRRVFPWLVAGVLVAGIALAFVVPVSKNRVSASYVLISTALSGALFWPFHLLADRLGVRLPLLSAWGVNPLILYLLQGFLDAIFMLPPMPWWYAAAPLSVIIPEIAFLLAAMSLAALWLRRRGFIFSL